VLDVVGLSGLADQRLSSLSRGMDRRLGVACALLGDPHTLVMDEPAQDLSPRETNWLYSLLRGYAQQGGTVLITSHLADEAADLADRVVSIASGRLVADQESADFVRTRLRPRVAVRTPHAERLTAVLTQEARKLGPVGRDGGPLKVVRESGSRVAVYGSSCAEVGEYAHRHGILVHQLTDESGDVGDAETPAPLDRADGRASSQPSSSAALSHSAAHPVAAPASPALEAEHPPATTESESVPAAAADSETARATSTSGKGAATPEHSSSPATSETAECAPPVSGTAPARASAESSSNPATSETEATTASTEQDSRPVPALVTAPASAADSAAVSTPRSGSAPEPALPRYDSAAPPAATASNSVRRTLRSPDAPTTRTNNAPRTHTSAHRAAPTKELAVDPVDRADPVNAVSPNSPSPWTPTRTPARAAAELPPQMQAVARPGPVAPLRYELFRLCSVRITWIAIAASIATALCTALVLARTGIGLPSASGSSVEPSVRLLTGWPSGSAFLLPPAAVAVGLLGALAFGEEFRYPALAPARSPVPRRISLLAAKLAVSGALAVVLSLVVAAVNAATLSVLFGGDVFASPSGSSSSAAGGAPWELHFTAMLALTVGCGWAGVLAGGIFRSATVGTAVVVAVPLLIAPAVRTLLGGPTGRSLDGLPQRLESVLLVPWPPAAEHWVSAGFHLASQPVGPALVLSLVALLFAYLITAVRSRAR
jgi:hypothetical protein